MRKIKLTNFRKPQPNAVFTNDTMYRVYLGNQKFIFFRNEKQTLQYLADTNRFLNNNLQILNQLYIQLFGEFREIWFYGDAHDLETTRIHGTFKNVDEAFDNVFIKSTHPENGNYYSFVYTEAICKRLIEATNAMIAIYEVKKIFVTLHKLNHALTQLETILLQLENYGKTDPSALKNDETDLKI